MVLLQQVVDAILALENEQDWQEALSLLNDLHAEVSKVAREQGVEDVRLVAVTGKDEIALEAARMEYSFSTEDGGANEGDEQAEENLSLLERLESRIAAQRG